MAKATLSPKILNDLIKKTQMTKGAIKNAITELNKKFPSCTRNAAAHLFAESRGVKVWRQLSKEDKASLPPTSIRAHMVSTKKRHSSGREQLVKIIDYETKDYFKKGHVAEINRAYSKGCYTSVHILARKIIENLIREILSRKFPPDTRENKELYFDTSQNRFKDFGVILKNLYDKRGEFELEKIKIIERLYPKAKEFKDDANDATHSWYHLVKRQKEIDDLDLQSMIELLKILAN